LLIPVKEALWQKIKISRITPIIRNTPTIRTTVAVRRMCRRRTRDHKTRPSLRTTGPLGNE
jgi:hypothetical protein